MMNKRLLLKWIKNISTLLFMLGIVLAVHTIRYVLWM